MYNKNFHKECLNECIRIVDDYQNYKGINELIYELSIVFNDNKLYEITINNLKRIHNKDMYLYYDFMLKHIDSYIDKIGLEKLEKNLLIV